MKSHSPKKFKKNTNIFLLTVATTVLALLFLFFGFIQREYLNQSRKDLSSTLSITSMLVEEKLQNVSDAMQQIINNNLNARSFFTGNTLRTDSYKLYLFHKDLCNATASDPFLSHVYAYRSKDNLIIGCIDKQTSNLIGFIDEAYLRNLDKAYREWSSDSYARMTAFPHVSAIHNVNNEPVISINNSYPVYSYKYGWLIANVSANTLKNYVDSIIGETSIKLEITDSLGQPIYTNLNGSRIRPAHQENIHSSSSFSGFSYDVYSNFSFWGYYAAHFYYVFTVLGLLALLISIYSFIRFALVKLKPIDSLIQDVTSYTDSESDSIGTGYNPEQLSYAFSNLIAENDHYRSKYGEWLTFKRSELMERLIGDSEQFSTGDLDEYCRYFDVGFLRSPISLAVVNVIDAADSHTADTIDMFFGFLKRTLNDYHVYLGNTVISEQMSNNELVLISDLAPGELKQLLVSYKDNPIRINIAVSDPITDFHDISSNYHSLAMVLKYSVVYNDPLILSEHDYSTLNREHSFEAYSLVLDICNTITHFDDSWNIKLENLREKLTRSLISKDELHTLLQFFLYNLDTNLSSISDNLHTLFIELVSVPCKEKASGFWQANDIIDFLFVHLQDYTTKAEEIRRNNSYHSMLINIEQYIHETIGSDQLSLLTISSHFNMNSSTFSTIFKKLFGEKFVDYVIRIRIQKSCELLANSDLTIEEIASSVGYGSPAAFSRVFKKETGCSPTDYRKNLPIN